MSSVVKNSCCVDSNHFPSPKKFFLGAALSAVVSAVASAIIGAGIVIVGSTAFAVVFAVGAIALILTTVLLIAAVRFSINKPSLLPENSEDNATIASNVNAIDKIKETTVKDVEQLGNIRLLSKPLNQL